MCQKNVDLGGINARIPALSLTSNDIRWSLTPLSFFHLSTRSGMMLPFYTDDRSEQCLQSSVCSLREGW